ncbi:MAG TPA: DUF2298 domain-containing protein, partial [Roseiflexaceae bacterium]|nr:DUF2298 domain-containing protein [Roseiflexaceae bacterium]
DARDEPAPPADDGGPVQLLLPLEEPAPPTPPAPPASPPAGSPLTILAGLWALCAVGLTLLTEVLVARGDIGRMNSVFKFGMQSWLLFAVVSGVALVWLWDRTRERRTTDDGRRTTNDGRRTTSDERRTTNDERRTTDDERRTTDEGRRDLLAVDRWSLVGLAWRGAAALLVAAALVYPLTATPARLADRYDPSLGPTLDGEAFMRSERSGWAENDRRFTFAQDAAAIQWVREHVAGTPIILEAHAEAYRWAGRFSVYTGLPTLLGWPWHMTQQRAVVEGGTIVANRQAVIRQIYEGADPLEALDLLRRYGVEYVVVGELERALYSPAGLAKFEALARDNAIRLDYAVGDTRIYRVAPGDHPPAVLHTALPVVPPTLPGKDLSLSVPVDLLPPVDEYGWNALARNQAIAVLLWLLAWYGLAALGLPLAVVVFGQRIGSGLADGGGRGVARRTGWSDGGYAWARLIGLLLVGYAVWLPVSARLWQYDRWGLLIGVLLVLLANALALAWLGRRTIEDDRVKIEHSASPAMSLHARSSIFNLHAVIVGLHLLRDQLKAHRRQILQGEALFLVGFGFLLAVRALNPDLWQPYWGGEKPFEFGLLNAVLRSPVMPPYSPFFSGGVVNYYYYGLFLVSLPVKATGIAPAVAFNLIVPTLFALVLAGAFALAARVAGSARVGLAAAVLVGVAGNLAGAFEASWLGSGGLRQALVALEDGLAGFGGRLGDWFVGPSRVVEHTINEFPYFAFLFADLHPHVIALPVTLLMIAIAFRIFHFGFAQPEMRNARSKIGSLIVGALAALTLGALAVTNSWDFPTYGLLLGGALLGRAWRAPAGSVWGRAWRLGEAVAAALLMGAAALALYAPFFHGYQAFVTGVGPVVDRTPVSDYLVLYGLFLAVLAPAVFGAAWRLLYALERARGQAPAGAVG